MARWDAQRVEALAPDPASLAAGRKLAQPAPWSSTGASDVLVWGMCQGSGSTPYQVSVDLTGPAFRCSCPSRKFPCKHALALLLMWSSGAVGDGSDPDAATADWAKGRSDRAEKSSVASRRPAAPVDPAAQARRLETRKKLMDAGMERFSLWLQDLVRAGTAAARNQGYAFWDDAAARLVDAQLPGLAARVRAMPGRLARDDQWSATLLEEVGLWWAAACAWARRDELDPHTAADLRGYVGWALPTADIRDADAVVGEWLVLGARRSDDGRLSEQRTWLRSETDGETLLVLDFAARGEALPVARMAGAVLAGTVSRYPGNGTRRALLHEDAKVAREATRLPRAGSVAEAVEATASQVVSAPWSERSPVLLTGRVAPGVPWTIIDSDGEAVALSADCDVWLLAAITGGHPTEWFGELEDGRFRPLSAVIDDDVVAL
jgi:hypothetical protein